MVALALHTTLRIMLRICAGLVVLLSACAVDDPGADGQPMGPGGKGDAWNDLLFVEGAPARTVYEAILEARRAAMAI